MSEEKVDFEKIDAKIIADLLSEIILEYDNTFHIVLESSKQIIDKARSDPGYVINDSTRKTYERKINAPLKEKTEKGWLIRFYTLSGWMHELQEVTEYRFYISPSYDIQHEKLILTKKAFSKVPDIMY